MARPIYFSMGGDVQDGSKKGDDVQPNEIPVEENEIDYEEVNEIDTPDDSDKKTGDSLNEYRYRRGAAPIFFSMGGDVQNGSKKDEDVQPNDIPVDEDDVEDGEVTDIDIPDSSDKDAGDVINKLQATGKLPIFFGMKS